MNKKTSLTAEEKKFIANNMDKTAPSIAEELWGDRKKRVSTIKDYKKTIKAEQLIDKIEDEIIEGCDLGITEADFQNALRQYAGEPDNPTDTSEAEDSHRKVTQDFKVSTDAPISLDELEKNITETLHPFLRASLHQTFDECTLPDNEFTSNPADWGGLKYVEPNDSARVTNTDYLFPVTHKPTDTSFDEEVEEQAKLERDCKSHSWELANYAKRLRNAHRKNLQQSRALRGTADATEQHSQMIEGVVEATEKINSSTVEPYNVVNGLTLKASVTKATLEILFSDLQIGKIGQNYNTEIAKQHMRTYGEKIMETIFRTDYDFERILFSSLGDIVEDHLKHGVQSATSTDSGLSEQMANAIKGIWKSLLEPLGSLEIPMEVVCIAGNHGSSQHKGMDMFKAGLYSYDYVIYKALEGYCKAVGFDHVKFNIPDGCFAQFEVYGRLGVTEHGYFNSATEKSMEDQMKKRGNQIKKHVDYFRCGDMHHVVNYDCGKMVLNGAFFGGSTEDSGVEYSSVIGYSALPAQVMMIHVDEPDPCKNTIKETIVVQFG